MPDAELNAMAKIAEVIEPLDQDARGRVIRWVAERFGMAVLGTRRTPSTSADEDESVTGAPRADFDSVSDLFDAAGPSTDAEKALVVAYWLQVGNDQPEWTSQRVNSELKHLGHGVGNITRAFGLLINRKPNLVQQVRKEGKSAQARKKYKVTLEGKRYVQRMIGGAVEDD